MKKILLTILVIGVFVTSLVLTSCSPILKNKEKREKQLLAVPGKGGHYFVNTEGYVIDNQMVSFYDLILRKIENDPKTDLSLPYPSIGCVDSRIHNDFVYFTMQCNSENDNKQADIILGYIDIRTDAVVYFITHVTTTSYNHLQLVVPVMANDNYYIFQQLFEGSSYPGYFVIDSKNNLLIENISDPTPYQDGTEYDSDFVCVNGVKYEITSSYHDKNILKFNDESLEINYDYVLTRSKELRKIDSIIGPYKRELRTTLISFENKRLYVILESEFGMFGAGELKPVVFEYIIESDTFEYIGCTNRMGISPYIFGVVPYEENKQ